MFKKIILVLLLGTLVSACSTIQTVTPVQRMQDKNICIVQDLAVREGFLNTYRQVLQEKGYAVKLLSKGAALDTCPLVTTYYALWSWDLAIYMSYVQIKVYRKGILVGETLYDSRNNPGFSKFVKGNEKIRELANRLFL
ncbi:hypothetical protein SPONL_385 [uncultured Candidatus Thioglobus sp.]|nr:hypothetical protein SPONL_385 [uncultured Candidatus Thioglobus sp.]